MESKFTREEVIQEFEKMIVWLEKSIIPIARRNGIGVGFEHSTLALYRRTVELLREGENNEPSKNM